MAAGGTCGSSTVWKHLRPTCGQPIGSRLAHTSATHLLSTVALFNCTLLTKLPSGGSPFKRCVCCIYGNAAATSRLPRLSPSTTSAFSSASSPSPRPNVSQHFFNLRTETPVAATCEKRKTALSRIRLVPPQGLFRIAAGASKLKKLKAALDCSTSQLEEFYSDPHAVAGGSAFLSNLQRGETIWIALLLSHGFFILHWQEP